MDSVDSADMPPAREPRAASAVVVAWLTHPVTLLALVVLLVNDHVLKAAWGNAVTGKLSDFAWLLVAPPLLATLVVLVTRATRAGGPGPRALVGASLAAVGAVFVLVKTTAVGAAAASAVLSVIAGPSVVLRDPTDLVALAVLLLSWRVARPRAEASAARGARPGVRWMVALPVAVLATAATSSLPEESTMHLAVLEDEIVVTEDIGTEHLRWFVSTDGVHWEQPDSREEHEEITTRFLAAGGTLDEACVPTDPLECYRPGEGLGVERSFNGGATWVEDWAVPEEVREELATRYRPRGDWLGTTGVAIKESATGFEVWAANRGDGLAVRHEDGTWERRGFAYRSDPPPVVPLPGEDTAMVYPVLKGIPFGVIGAWLVLLLGAVELHRRGERPRGWRGAGLATLGAFLAVVAALVNAQESAVRGQEVATGVIFGSAVVPAGVILLVIFGIVLVLRGATALGHRRFVGPMAFGALGVVLAAELSQLVLAVVVSAAVVLAATVVASRLDARPEPELEPAVDHWGR